jgi:hypothetical protein
MTLRHDTEIAAELGCNVRWLRSKILDVTPGSHLRKGRERYLLPRHVDLVRYIFDAGANPDQETDHYAKRLEAEIAERQDRGIVYIIQGRRAPLVKIGYTSNFWERFGALQRGSPDVLGINCVIYGGRDLEAHLHQRFAKYRKHGEWFKLGAPVKDFISHVRTRGQAHALNVIEWQKCPL